MVRGNFPSQGFGSSHRQFEIQLDRLTRRYERERRVDCLIVGNSHTLRGIQPVYIERALARRLGRPIVCQNFGLNGTSASLFARVAMALDEQYHPRLVIVGISAVDFDRKWGGRGNRSIQRSSWFRYHYAHRVTVDAVAVEYLYAYRYYLGWRSAFFSPAREVDVLGEPFENILPNGFFPSSNVFDATMVKELIERLDQASPSEREEILKKVERGGSTLSLLGRVALDISEIEQFERLLASDIPVLLVEVPFSPYAYTILESAVRKHEEFLALMGQLTARYDRRFIPSYGIVAIPEEGWMDVKHMNQTGAEVFSQWLGEQLEWMDEIPR